LEKLDTAKRTVSTLDHFVKKVHFCPSGPLHPEMDQLIYDARHSFVDAMDDDFNIAPALAALFQFIHRIHAIMDEKGLAPPDKDKVLKAMERVNTVLGVIDLEPPRLERDLEILIEKRARAREAKEWETADRLRRELKERGIEVIDTKEGTVWRQIP
jgi:cysteinyl-tRNA synthetase